MATIFFRRVDVTRSKLADWEANYVAQTRFFSASLTSLQKLPSPSNSTKLLIETLQSYAAENAVTLSMNSLVTIQAVGSEAVHIFITDEDAVLLVVEIRISEVLDHDTDSCEGMNNVWRDVLYVYGEQALEEQIRQEVASCVGLQTSGRRCGQGKTGEALRECFERKLAHHFSLLHASSLVRRGA